MHDFELYKDGSMYLVTPLSDAARKWVDENVSEDRVYFGAAFGVNSDCIKDLTIGMLQAGLSGTLNGDKIEFVDGEVIVEQPH